MICSHIHSPADKHIGEIHYLNSGDWVESLTALVEDDQGAFEILTYEECRRRLRPPPVEPTTAESSPPPARLLLPHPSHHDTQTVGAASLLGSGR